MIFWAKCVYKLRAKHYIQTLFTAANASKYDRLKMKKKKILSRQSTAVRLSSIHFQLALWQKQRPIIDIAEQYS